VKFKYGNRNGGLGLKMGRHRAYPKIPAVAMEKACDALTNGFSEPED
jgi:hypothetical protein